MSGDHERSEKPKATAREALTYREVYRDNDKSYPSMADEAAGTPVQTTYTSPTGQTFMIRAAVCQGKNNKVYPSMGAGAGAGTPTQTAFKSCMVTPGGQKFLYRVGAYSKLPPLTAYDSYGCKLTMLQSDTAAAAAAASRSYSRHPVDSEQEQDRMARRLNLAYDSYSDKLLDMLDRSFEMTSRLKVMMIKDPVEVYLATVGWFVITVVQAALAVQPVPPPAHLITPVATPVPPLAYGIMMERTHLEEYRTFVATEEGHID